MTEPQPTSHESRHKERARPSEQTLPHALEEQGRPHADTPAVPEPGGPSRRAPLGARADRSG
ncbi:hypothetical protein, partial [Streptomyces sp. SID1034]